MKATSDDCSGAVPDDAVPQPASAVRSSTTVRERLTAAEREATGPRLYYRTMAHFFSSYARGDALERDAGEEHDDGSAPFSVADRPVTPSATRARSG